MMLEKDVKLNVGCGSQRLAGYWGLDIRVENGTDVVCDLGDGLPFADGSVDHIYSKSFLEHVDDLEFMLGEFVRVLKPGGSMYIYVPHWRNPFYYSDYTHRQFFGLATFDYFAKTDEQIYRHVPVYSDIRFKTKTVRLLLKSPFSLCHWPLKGVQWLINRRPRWQLFFEYHLAGIMPCYAIEYQLQKPE